MTDIVVPPTIQAMPPAPLPTDPEAVFDAKGQATVVALAGFVDEANALGVATRTNAIAAQERAVTAQGASSSAASSATAAGNARDSAIAAAQSAINSPATRATSSTTAAISAGQKWFATQPGKGWIGGEAVVVAAQGDPVGTRMYGIVNDYNGSSGLLGVVVPAGGFRGSGTNAGWNISVTGSHDGVVLQGAGPGQLLNPISLGVDGTGRVLISVDGVAVSALVLESSIDLLPPGARGEFYMNTPPPGWLKANGAALSRATYARLFARIGTFYGAGDGSTTFNLPNDYGLFARGWDESGAVDPARAFGSVQGSQNLAHNHGATYGAGAHGHTGTVAGNGTHNHAGTALSAGAHSHDFTKGAGDTPPGNYANSDNQSDGGVQTTTTAGAHPHTLAIDAGGFHGHSLTIDAVGEHNHGIPTDGGVEARPVNRAVLVCIKY